MAESTGIVTVCFDRAHDGQRYGACARRLVKSLEGTAPDIPRLVMTNVENLDVDADVRVVDLPDDRNRETKIGVYGWTPFDRTAFLDADAVVLSSAFADGFLFLDVWDVALAAISGQPSLASRRVETILSVGAVTKSAHAPYFSSGIVFFRKKADDGACGDFFARWLSGYRTLGGGRDMPSMNIALWQTHDLRVCPLPPEWQVRDRRSMDAIVFHEGGRHGVMR